MAINDYKNPLIVEWYTDNQGNKISILRTNEVHTVVDNQIHLLEIPDPFNKVNITGMYEIPYGKPITDANQYSVNYAGWNIQFHPSKEGQSITIASYYSRGLIRIPDSMIYTSLDSSGNITQTLSDVLEFAKIKYLEPVSTFTNIAATYPNPSIGDTVQCEDTGKFYRWDGTWKYFQILNSNQLSALVDEVNAHKADFMPHGVDNAGFHNSIYRGLFLGNEVTSEQYQAISNGTFDDMYIGDYWTINGINWRIAALNYYRSTGDSNVPGNHIVVVPDQSLYNHVMNDADTTEGGYTGSKMYTEGLTQAKTIINNAFSGHVVTFRAYFCNAVADGQASAGAWVDSTVDLMNEIMVYGSVVNGHSAYGFYNIGTEKSQLPLFSLNPQSINTRYTYWLRDVVSAAYFARVDGLGFAYCGNASNSIGVRPRFLIS